MDFTQNTFFVGMDVGKFELVLVLLIVQPSRKTTQIMGKFENTQEGHQKIIKWLKKNKVIIDQTAICLENTGQYDDEICDTLCLAGYCVYVEATTILQQVRGKNAAKDDVQDAIALAQYANGNYHKLHLFIPKTLLIAQISLVYSERRRLKTLNGGLNQKYKELGYNMTEEKQKALGMDKRKAMWLEQIALNNTHIKQLEQEIKALIMSDDHLAKRYKLLLSIDGVGPVIASFLIVHYGNQEKLDYKKIACRYGFAPHSHESGTSIRRKAKSFRHGNSEARGIFNQAAITLQTHKAHYQEYRKRKLLQGKPNRLINNNVINKFLKTICTIWNNASEYQPEYQSTFATNSN